MLKVVAVNGCDSYLIWPNSFSSPFFKVQNVLIGLIVHLIKIYILILQGMLFLSSQKQKPSVNLTYVRFTSKKVLNWSRGTQQGSTGVVQL